MPLTKRCASACSRACVCLTRRLAPPTTPVLLKDFGERWERRSDVVPVAAHRQAHLGDASFAGAPAFESKGASVEPQEFT